jgi:vacuolar-type H+-ATPase subunit F/Vma7
MSRLLVVTRPGLEVGFQLAGVEAFAVPDVESAQELIGDWLAGDEEGLLAVDEQWLASMEPAFLKRLRAAAHLPYLPLPAGQPSSQEVSLQRHISELIRRAIGFHLTFKGEDTGT